MSIIDFKSTKCKHCYKCVRNCEVKAIQIKDERAEIMEDHCILCGTCLKVCPQEAKTLSSELEEVKALVRSGRKVVVTMAPSYVGLMKFKTMGQVRTALLKLGFTDVRETGEGAAFVTGEYEKLVREGKMENIITTCCPSANDLIEMYYPELVKYMAPVVSPMVASGMLIKKEYGDDAAVVFLGPCIAKKKEARDERNGGIISNVINFDDINRWLSEEKIDIYSLPDMPFEKFDPKVNRLYPVTNGIINSVISTERGNRDGYRKFYVHGEKNCIDLCKSMIRGDISRCFIEINMCSGGCIKGPAVNTENISRFKVKLDMEENITREPVPQEILDKAGEGISFARQFADRSVHDPMPSEEQIREILKKTEKFTPEDELNCGACGYPTCRDKAIAVFQHKAELDMCIPYMHSKAESLSNLVMDTSPNAVILADKDMKIIEYSAVGEKYFGKTRTEALKMYLFELLDPADCEYVFKSHTNIHGKKVEYPDYNLCTLQNIVYIPKEDVVLLSIMDITKQENEARKENEKKMETVDLAQKVINKQMRVAQEIAGLLGETTAETKTTLTKLSRMMVDDDSRETPDGKKKAADDRTLLWGGANKVKVDTTYNNNLTGGQSSENGNTGSRE